MSIRRHRPLLPSDQINPSSVAGLNRRRFLQYGAGSVAGVGLISALAACGSDSDSSSSSSGGGAPPDPGEPKPGGTIKFGISDHTDTDSLDPAVNFTIFGLLTSGLLYDTLVFVNNDWSIEPMLATDWDSNADATQYTFRLRDDVVLHSGKTFDSEDVAFCIRRLLDSKTGSGAYNQLSAVLKPNGVTAVDKTTVRFDLYQADGFFPIKMGWFWTRMYEGGTTKFTVDSPVGSGPFIPKQFTAAQGFDFVRNDNYWQEGLPYLDSISGIAIPELATKADALKTGRVDIIDQPDFSTIPEWVDNPEYRNVTAERGPTFEYGIIGDKPFDNLDVRRGIKMLIDREAYVELICRGEGQASIDSVVAPGDPFYPSDVEPIAYDPEQGKSLLEGAGFPFDDDWKVWTSPPFPALGDGAAALQQSLTEAGFNASIQNVPPSEFFGEIYFNENFVCNYYLPQHPSLLLPLAYGTDGIYNVSHLSDPEIDKWLADAQASTDESTQIELYGEVQRKFNDEGPTIQPFHFNNFYPAKARLAGAEWHWSDQIDARKAYVTD